MSDISIQCLFSDAKTESLVNKIFVWIQVIQEEALTSIKPILPFILGQIRGLLGNFNGDDNDDFITRHNLVLPSDSSMRDLHYKFGMTCKLSPSF